MILFWGFQDLQFVVKASSILWFRSFRDVKAWGSRVLRFRGVRVQGFSGLGILGVRVSGLGSSGLPEFKP